jgi:signal transduction histidine kinase/DNA-binding response OmpR family regulator
MLGNLVLIKMKCIKHIIFYILIVQNILYAQNISQLPRYYKALRVAHTDSEKVEAYRNLCFNLSLIKPDSGIYYGNKGLEIALKIKFIKGIGDCYNSIGWCQIKKGDYASAKSNLLQAKTAFEQLGNRCYLSVVYSNLGNLYYNQNSNAEALDYFLESLKLNEGCKDEGFKSSGIYSIGTIYNTQKEFNRAIHYFKEAYQINILNKDFNKSAECINGIGNAHIGLKNYDSALIYLEQSFQVYSKYSNLSGAAYAKESIGSVYLENKQFKLALQNFELAKANFETVGSKYDVCYELIMIGDVYQQMDELEMAIKYKQKALSIADSHQFMSLKQTVLSGISDLYAQKKDYKSAFDYYKQANSIKDSLSLEKQQIKLDELKTKFETEQKDKAITLLNKDKLVNLAESNRQKLLKNIFIAGTVLFLLLTLVLYKLYQIKQKSAITLAEKNKLIQIEKERAEANEKFKQRFLANMSHEIRTPMTAIIGMTELLEDAHLKNPYQQYLDGIKQSSQNLLVLINDILDLSKLEAGKTELDKVIFDLHQMLYHIHTMFIPLSQSKNIAFNLEIHADVPQYIVSDPKRLNQILMNLIGNAFKFTLAGSVSLTLTKIEKKLHFSIQDTGIGIHENDQHEIFQAFMQLHDETARNFGGTGLGLSIAKNLAALFGSVISIKSEIGIGSHLSFTIPFEAASEQALQTFPSKVLETQIDTSFDSNAFHIILIEDNAYNRLLVADGLKRKLKQLRFTIAENGKQAITILKSGIKLNPNERVLILMDIQMPEMDGYTATRIIRNELAKPLNEIPIIAFTASVIKSDVDACLNAGMNDFVAKPFQIKDLLAKILEYAKCIPNSELPLQSDLTNTKPPESSIDLTYLLDFTENHPEEMRKYVSIFKERVAVRLAEAKLMLQQNNIEQVVSVLHSIRPILVSFGMRYCENSIAEIEQNKNAIKSKELRMRLNHIDEAYNKALKEIDLKYPI